MRRARIIAILLTCALGVSCASGGGGSPTPTASSTPTPSPPPILNVEVIVPPSGEPDPFTDVVAYRVIMYEAGTEILREEFNAGDPLELTDLDPGADRVLRFEGLDGNGETVSQGITTPFDLTEDDGQLVYLYFARRDSFGRINGPIDGRTDAHARALSDGRVMWVGGTIGGDPTDGAVLYDPWTDTTADLPAAPSPHADAAVIRPEPNVLLVLGGLGTGGTPTDTADAFLYDPATQTGSWKALPSMADPRHRAFLAPLGSSRWFVGGGDDGGGAVDSTEILEWDGNTATWEPGPNVEDPKRWGMAAGVGADIALIGQGVHGNGSYDNDVELYTYSPGGGGTAGSLNNAGNINPPRQGLFHIHRPDDSVLTLGGFDNDNPSDRVERVSYDGSTNVEQLTSLPSPRVVGGGGALPDGTWMLVGGDEGTPGSPQAVDEAMIYDPVRDAYTVLASSPGPTLRSYVAPLPDGTRLVVMDGTVERYMPDQLAVPVAAVNATAAGQRAAGGRTLRISLP